MTYEVRKHQPEPVGYFDDEKGEWVESTPRPYWEVVSVDGQGQERPIDGRSGYYTKQAAYRRCRQLNQNTGQKSEK